LKWTEKFTLKLFVVLNLICEPRNANTQRENTLTSFRAITKTDIFYWWNLWQFKNKPRFVHTSEIYLQMRAAFHHSFFYLWNPPCLCYQVCCKVFSCPLKQNMFLKYIWMFLKYIVDPVTVELSKPLQFLFFSMANDRIVCIVSRFQVKLSRAKVQSSGTNFVASQAKLSAIPWSFFTM